MAKWAENFSLNVEDDERGGVIHLKIDGEELPWNILRDGLKVDTSPEGVTVVHISIPIVRYQPAESTLEKDLVPSWGKPGDKLELTEDTPEPPDNLIFIMIDDEEHGYPFLAKEPGGWSWFKMPDINSEKIPHDLDPWDYIRTGFHGRVFQVVGVQK